MINKKVIVTALLICLCSFWQVKANIVSNKMTENSVFDVKGNIIKGKVVDILTNKPIHNANIFVEGTTIGTVSNKDGSFVLKNVPFKVLKIRVSCVGFLPITQNIDITKDNIDNLEFMLEQAATNLNDVVVTSNRTEVLRYEAPSLVNTIDASVMERANIQTVSQALNFTPGVRVENSCQNCGFTQVRINGMDGKYSQILIDSRPVFSALAGVYGLEQIPVSMIDRVEVVRGGGSSLFGSNAIAGTINIITKEPMNNSAEISHTLMGINGLKHFENATDFNATIVSDDRKSGVAIFGQNRERDGYDYDGDGFTEVPLLKNQTIGFLGYFKPTAYSKLTAEYHHMNEKRRGGDNLDLPEHEAYIAESVKHNINNMELKYDLYSSNSKHKLSAYAAAQDVQRDSYYGAGKDPHAYGNSSDLAWIVGAQYNYKMDKLLFMPSELTLGAEYSQDILEDNQPDYDRHVEQTVKIASVFAQNEWKNDKFGILIGGRMDDHSYINGLIFSPRVSFRYNPTKNINIRTGYSYGFRAPQAFDEDLHIECVGGTVQVIDLDPNLKAENSHSLTISADNYFYLGKDMHLNVMVEGFYTVLENAFALKENGTIAGIIHLLRYNSTGAKVKGLNIESRFSWHDYLSLQTGWTFAKARYFKPQQWSDGVEEETKMSRTPDVYGYFNFKYNPIKALALSLTGNYTGSMIVEHCKGYISVDRTETTPSFFDMSFKAAYSFQLTENNTLEVNAGVQNIFDSFQKDFDKGQNRDAGYVYGPALPRTYFVGVKLKI